MIDRADWNNKCRATIGAVAGMDLSEYRVGQIVRHGLKVSLYADFDWLAFSQIGC